MTPTPTETPSFDARAFDRDCRNFLHFKEIERQAKANADLIRARLTLTVERHGLVPAGAEKSRRIEHPHYIATVTTGTSIVIDDSKVLDLELLLSRIRKSDAFKFLFERHVEYSLAKTAKDAIETTPWPKKYREQIVALYSSCFSPKPKTPSLEVETRESVQQREAKAAAKKAKPGKKAA